MKARIYVSMAMALTALLFLFTGCTGNPTAPKDTSIEGAGSIGESEKENHPPVIKKLTAKPSHIRVGTSSKVAVDAEDLDGDVLTYSWEASLGYILGSGGQVRYTAAACCVGENQITVKVEDGRGGRATESVRVTVVR